MTQCGKAHKRCKHQYGNAYAARRLERIAGGRRKHGIGRLRPNERFYLWAFPLTAFLDRPE